MKQFENFIVEQLKGKTRRGIDPGGLARTICSEAEVFFATLHADRLLMVLLDAGADE